MPVNIQCSLTFLVILVQNKYTTNTFEIFFCFGIILLIYISCINISSVTHDSSIPDTVTIRYASIPVTISSGEDYFKKHTTPTIPAVDGLV